MFNYVKNFFEFIQMKTYVAVLIIFLQIFVNCANLHLKNYILVAIKDGGMDYALQLAENKQYKFVKEIRGFDNIFLFEEVGDQNRTQKRSGISRTSINKDERVLWSSQQKILKRDKRDLIIYTDYVEELDDLYGAYRPLFNDELWNDQWYMQNVYNNTSNRKLDLNVLPVYARGLTGSGVRVSVLDDGIEYNHEDLIENYDSEISWDCNNDSPDPRPNYKSISNRHGTRCAGEIAMAANNKKCGVGIAFNARIGGIKLLDGVVYDLVEGMALGFAHKKVDIYSSSWGPTDDGETLEQPGIFARMAMERGIREGRNGLGVIYVWASGNGGSKFDNCNCDGYATSIYTITVGSVTQSGDMPWYGESCSSILTVTYSSGKQQEGMIATTDLRNGCTVEHTGTSASAPLAAGIIALGLEANPYLSWRDVQHIIVRTSSYEPLKNNNNWVVNAAGRQYNTQFGFGLMNADSLVSLALQWKSVPIQKMERINGVDDIENDINGNHSKVFRKLAHVYFYNIEGRINFLEHIELEVFIDNELRGNLEIYLTSPSGTRIPLLEKRPRDKSVDGFKGWTFMSVGTWSENPKGVWVMEIADNVTLNSFISIEKCTIYLYGTYTDPQPLQK